jgi:hypothetical protein
MLLIVKLLLVILVHFYAKKSLAVVDEEDREVEYQIRYTTWRVIKICAVRERAHRIA